jgi:hypothetical protein
MTQPEPPRTPSGLLNWARASLDEASRAPAARPRPDELVAPEVGPAPAAEAPDDAAAAARESERRMGLIVAYLKDPASDPAFADKALMFSIFTEERRYQADRARRLQADLQALPPPAEAMGLSPAEAAALPEYDGLEARRAELVQAHQAASTRQAQLFLQLKRLTGKTGKTGGTGLLATSAGEAPPITTAADDVLGDLFGP